MTEKNSHAYFYFCAEQKPVDNRNCYKRFSENLWGFPLSSLMVHSRYVQQLLLFSVKQVPQIQGGS